MTTNRLNIYLIKDSFKDEPSITKSRKKPIPTSVGNFYYENSPSHPPEWMENFFGNELSVIKALSISSAKGLLLTSIQVNKKTVRFALCFGHGRFLLSESTIERRFGLMVTVNTVDPTKIRVIEKTNIGPNTKMSREQMSTSVEAQQFGIDMEQDLVRTIKGTTKHSFGLGKTIQGSDMLSLNLPVDIHNIRDLLHICYRRYRSNDYKKDFEWIDRIHEVKEPALVSFLDNEIVDLYNAKDFTKLWLAIPDLIDWENTSGFRYLPKDQNIYDDIEISQYSQVKGKIKNIEDLLDNVNLISAETGRPVRHWSLYDCLYAEVDHQKKKYFLNKGNWFEVDENFVKNIKKAYLEIPVSTIKLPQFNHSSEEEYNEHASVVNSSMLLMDKKTIPFGGNTNKIEYADLCSLDRHIIHVKRYGSSSVLSHLFMQGLNSAEYLSDNEFRLILNKKLKPKWRVPAGSKFKPSEYEIVFAIIQRGNQLKPQIPFFSMVTLKNVYKRLTTRGFKVAILRIDVTKV